MLQFPQLSRQPAIRTKETTLDPTLRDSYENGMVSTRARYTRQRRQFDLQLDLLTPDDKSALNEFVQTQTVYGAQLFSFPDNRDPANPAVLSVRFSKLPAYTEAGWHDGAFRFSCTFQIEEV